jgi:similar to stage IV sporulation protein
MIRIEGLSLEKFLNMAGRAGVKVFDARRVSYTVLDATLTHGDFPRLQKQGLDRYRITVLKRGGAASGFLFLGRRKVLLFGLLLVAAAAVAASLFVWSVRVTGLDEPAAAGLLRELEAEGIAPGMYKGGFDADDIETQILIDHHEIAWIDIQCRGVVLVIEAVPAEPAPEVVDNTRPCNVVAEKAAYIESITPLAGRAAVTPGDTVRAGDVLISGLIWDPGMPRMMCAARGSVIGSVWYSASVGMPLYVETREPTGRTQTQRKISIGSDSATVDGQCTFDAYDTKILKTYHIGRILPVYITVLEHSEVTIEKTPADLEILKITAEEAAYLDAQAKMPEDAEIAGHRTFFHVGDDTLTARVYLQTYEDIGKTVYLEE